MPIEPLEQQIEGMPRAMLAGGEKPRGESVAPELTDVFAIRLPQDLSHNDVGIAGEGFYQPGLHAVEAQMTALGEQVGAILVPDPDNPFDKTAVEVLLVAGSKAFVVGHLGRHSQYKPIFGEIGPRGLICAARLSTELADEEDPIS